MRRATSRHARIPAPQGEDSTVPANKPEEHARPDPTSQSEGISALTNAPEQDVQPGPGGQGARRGEHGRTSRSGGTPEQRLRQDPRGAGGPDASLENKNGGPLLTKPGPERPGAPQPAAPRLAWAGGTRVPGPVGPSDTCPETGLSPRCDSTRGPGAIPAAPPATSLHQPSSDDDRAPDLVDRPDTSSDFDLAFWPSDPEPGAPRGHASPLGGAGQASRGAHGGAGTPPHLRPRARTRRAVLHPRAEPAQRPRPG